MKRVNDQVTREMARRYTQFHIGEDWETIRIWGLFYKSNIRKHLRNGWLISNSSYDFRCLGWYYPSEEYWESSIKPIILNSRNICSVGPAQK